MDEQYHLTERELQILRDVIRQQDRSFTRRALRVLKKVARFPLRIRVTLAP